LKNKKSTHVDVVTEEAQNLKDLVNYQSQLGFDSSYMPLISYTDTALTILELDLAHMRKTFNERIEYVHSKDHGAAQLLTYEYRYFRQLQAISDTVAEEEYEGPLAEALEKIVVEKNVLEGKIVAGIARARYLRTLTEERAAVNDEQDDDDEKFCIICRNEASTVVCERATMNQLSPSLSFIVVS
jgi:hypothetical protein